MKAFPLLFAGLFSALVQASDTISLSDLQVKNDQSEPVSLHYPDQVVLLDFWASWCGPCRQSFPWMNKMQARYGEAGLKVVAINLDSEQELATEFLKEIPAQFTVLFDQQGKSAEQFSVEGMPMSYLFDRKGKLIHRMIGFSPAREAEHEAKIKALLSPVKNPLSGEVK